MSQPSGKGNNHKRLLKWKEKLLKISYSTLLILINNKLIKTTMKSHCNQILVETRQTRPRNSLSLTRRPLAPPPCRLTTFFIYTFIIICAMWIVRVIRAFPALYAHHRATLALSRLPSPLWPPIFRVFDYSTFSRLLWVLQFFSSLLNRYKLDSLIWVLTSPTHTDKHNAKQYDSNIIDSTCYQFNLCLITRHQHNISSIQNL